jgi:hypothetical protein
MQMLRRGRGGTIRGGGVENGIAERKVALRKAAQAARARAHASAELGQGAQVLGEVLADHAGRVLSGYMPMRSEIDPLPAMAAHEGPVCVHETALSRRCDGAVGPGRRAARLPGLRADWRLDFVVVNGENATSGAGLSPAHAARFSMRAPIA